ncbi:MAG: phytanoyl-CoA dioxygenase family protein [Armatimonadetes bacterium]|nr:phytanoyl-CoA dioxygenase family protein [Armatimonadota bacterium]
MIFTNEQREQFRTEGYLAVPNFWTPIEVAAMQKELERLKAEGLLRNVATAGDGQTASPTKANLQLCPMYPHSAFFRAMPFAPKVAEAVASLLGDGNSGDSVVLHLDQVFLKPAKHGAGTNWHQDNAYFQIPDPLKGTALWTAVHNATIANGTLRVIPRAFDTPLPHERDGDSDHHIRCFPDESLAIPLEIVAGGALFFAYGTPHATGANTTDTERAGVALHFIHANQSGRARGGFETGKRPVLTGENATGGEAEYGTRIAGTWDAQVARVLAA